MQQGLDSSFFRPTLDQLAEAHAAGVRVWGGYLATKSNTGLASPWDAASFARVKSQGLTAIAFCSGWDDPVGLAQLAAKWGLLLCLDVEGGIRADGPWVQSFLDASNAGLYGNWQVHLGRRASFHIMAGYPGYNPGVAWPKDQPRPNTPCAWQWQGTHQEFGGSVDRGNYDDWFAHEDFSSPTGGDTMTGPQAAALMGFLIPALAKAGFGNIPNNADEVGNAIVAGNYDQCLAYGNAVTFTPPVNTALSQRVDQVATEESTLMAQIQSMNNMINTLSDTVKALQAVQQSNQPAIDALEPPAPDHQGGPQ